MDFTELNIVRKKCAQKTIIGSILAVIGGLMFLIPYAGEESAFALQQFIGVFVLAVGIIFIGFGAAKFQQLKNNFKQVHLKKMIQELYREVRYEPKAGIGLDRIYACKFIKRADRSHTEDLIIGEYDDVHFETCDVRLEERHVRHTKNGTQVYYVTYFLGRFFEFDFPKEFKGQIIVTEGGMFTLFSNLKKIEMESVDFNKKFKTYSTDEHNAFYILTPHLMEEIMDLEKRNPGQIGLSFIGNRLSIAINNHKNTFELNMFKEIDGSTLEELKRDLGIIQSIVTELKLNRNIFKYEEVK